MNQYEEYLKARAEGKEYLELLPHETDESAACASCGYLIEEQPEQGCADCGLEA